MGDGAEDNGDVSTFIEEEEEEEYGGGETLDMDSINDNTNTNIMVDMRAKRIVLTEHGDCFFLILFFLFVSGFDFWVFFFVFSSFLVPFGC